MASKVKILVSKNPSMADERVDIKISGLEIAQKMTLHGSVTLENGAKFESFGHYIAGEEGQVWLDKQKSFGGTYEGIEPMGPLWSMVPSPWNKRKHERFIVKNPEKPFIFSLQVYKNFLTLEQIRNSSESSMFSLDIIRTYSAPGVRCEEVRVGRVRGYLFLPSGRGKFPGVISMSGGYPGAMKFKGALLASHGFATLALKYFGEDDLPKGYRNLDLAYFEEAAVYLKHHPKVSGKEGVGIVANCLGACLALGLASDVPPGVIKCVVSVNGWFFSYWSLEYRGNIWNMPPNYRSESEMKPDGSLRLMNEIDLSDPYAKNSWPYLYKFFKRRDIGFLMIYGEADESLNAKSLTKSSKLLLKNEGHENHQVLLYPHAGHAIEHAFCPHGKVVYDMQVFFSYGGRQPGHERAQEDAWLKILTFLHRNLSLKGESKL